MELKEVVSRLTRFAPLNLAGSWDNVGLLVEPTSKGTVRSMILTNDLTEDVLDETLSVGADFILSYHPPIFKPLKKITSGHWKERIVARCLKSGIAVYSPHTCYDALEGGVNDWLVGAFGKASVRPIEMTTSKPKYGFKITFCGPECKQQLNQIGDQLKQKLPSDGTLIDLESSVILCSHWHLTACVSILASVQNKEFTYTISKNEALPKANHGMGRSAHLQSEQTIGSVVQRLKAMTGLSHVRLALARGHDMDTVVHTGAVCAGSGLSVLRGSDADVLISGEMSHHDVLEFTQTGHTVILLEHSNSERGFLSAVLQPKLQSFFNKKVSVLVSTADKDPLQFA